MVCTICITILCTVYVQCVCVARLYSLYSVAGSVCILFIQLTQCVCSMCLQCTEFVESYVCVYSLSEKFVFVVYTICTVVLVSVQCH